MRPLDFLGRIKVKLGLVIVLAVGTAFVVNEVGINAGLSRGVRITVALVLALIMVQLMAMGMTKPLRQMAKAAQTIAKGRYTLRVNATSRDEVGELARAFNAMAADLGEVDRQRRELVANVSHELRTPITGLRAVLENVVDGVSTADPDTMRTALAQTERLGRLVAQLLDLSRLDSGVRLIEADAVELSPLLEQAVREAALAREDVRLLPSAPADLVVCADPDLLAQVLANLLDNAVRHSPPGGSVGVTGEASGDGVRITITDQGPGIPASARGRVFERFSRLDAGRAADSGGSGLGLAIVKEIVELHGGSIRIGDCAGCRMIVELPGRTTMAGVPLEREQASGDDVLVAPLTAGGVEEPGVTAGVPDERVPPEVVMEPAGAVVGEVILTAEADVTADVTAEVPPSVLTGAVTHPVPTAHAAVQVVASQVVASPVVASQQQMSIGRLGRMLAGGVIGLMVGFLVGLFAAVFVSVTMNDGAALVTLVLTTALVGAIGVSLGAGTGRRGSANGQPYPPVLMGTGGQMAGTPATGPQAGASHVGTSQAGTAHVGATQVGGSAGHVGPGYGAGLQGHGPQVYGPQPPPPPYVPPPLFPRPDLPETPRWLLPAAAGAGVFAAVALPDAQVGLGFVLVTMVLGAAALPAVLRRITPWTIAFGLIAYWLVAMAAVRDADWLVGLLFLAGCGLLALAVSGAGFGWLGVIRGGVSVLLALGPVPYFLGKPLKRLTAKRRILPTLAALGITAVLLLVFGLLFASADPVFASYLERLTTTPDWAESVPQRIFLFFMGAVLLAAVVLVALRPVVDPIGPDVKVRVTKSVWLVPLTAVNLLFAAFVAIQITTLFGGNAWVLRTAGLTYAEYARQGFFQLVIVSVFVLGIVAVAGGLLKTERRERWVLAGQLGVLCALTMVVLASALHRMDLYTDAYGLSRLRLSVEATVWWLGALFALVMLAGAARMAGRGSGWLPRTIVLVTGLGLGAFAIVNPDLQVAQTQLEVRGVLKMDADYLGDLGAEAVPALDRLPEPQRSCVLRDVITTNGLDRPDPWNGWNLARSQARELLAKRPVGDTSTCASVDRSD
ncbi:DUF4153 domain-containing protein [Nonomuraea rhizosphaerae]|uniref:DUF4153 domain-containing protein n=1 Tax=Nonomuraea rhizosphaerae TaxID=2665663 RepID=UPI001C5D421C|nr:DUF4153 domain-containing protein [Nonomuraea rhizosphaerae]